MLEKIEYKFTISTESRIEIYACGKHPNSWKKKNKFKKTPKTSANFFVSIYLILQSEKYISW